MQNHLARELGVSLSTVVSWESSHTQVATRLMPKVMAFLGYDPRQEATGFGGRIRALRERQGLSRAALAAKLGLKAFTVSAWEHGRVKKPSPLARRQFEEFLAGA